MLEYIRSSAQSFGVKIAFGVIILVFVFWGVGNFNDRDYSNVVAMVNGEPIVALEFEKAYHDAEEYILRSNPGITREQLAKQHLGRQVLRDLIQMTLLSQEARRAGVVVTPEEMLQVVKENKAFQDDKGNFDPEAYKRILAARRMSIAQFEKELSDQLLRDKMFSLITASVWVDPDEARNRFKYLRERRNIDYLFIDADQFKDKAQVNDTELKTYYDNHQSEFAIPARADISYIEIAPEKLVQKDEAAAKAWYEANKNQFERKEQVHASHILVPLAEDADENAVKAANEKLAKVRAELDQGKNFAALADEINEANAAGQGGELGWVSRGQTVPQFEEAIFALPVGKISQPIRTQFGLHLALVDQKREAGIAPFAEVADEAYKAVAFEQGMEKLHDVLDNLIEDNILLKPQAESAAKYGLTAQKTGLSDKNALMEKLKIKADAADALLATAAGAPLDTALESGDNYIVAKVEDVKPAGIKPFADVSKDIANILIQQKALNLAIADATEILKKIKNESLDAAIKQYPAIRQNQIVDRTGTLEGFASDPAFTDSLFASPIKHWLSAPMAVETNKGASGAILAYINKIEPMTEGEFASVAEILGRAAKQERMEGIYELFIGQLAKNAKVEITNQNLIDRIN